MKIYKAGEDILTQRAKEVSTSEFGSEKLTQLINDLNAAAKETGAVGFSAPQLGYSIRVMTISMEFDKPIVREFIEEAEESRQPIIKPVPNTTFINPELTYSSPQMSEEWEGCASFDSQIALVSRSVLIRFRSQNSKGNTFEGELKDFAARVFQHELDHLNGTLMDSRATETEAIKRFKP